MLLTLLNSPILFLGDTQILEGSASSSNTCTCFLQVVGNPRFSYTSLSPSVDSRQIWASYTDGNDANDGLTISTPKKTQSGAYSLLRNGYPDWIYFKAGDTWSGDKWNGSNIWSKSGRSESEPMVLTSYGDGDRPQFLTNASSFWSINGSSGAAPLGNLAFIGLHFYSNWTGREEDQPSAFASVHPTENLLIEDCYIDSYQVGISIAGSGGLKRNVKIRGNVIVDCFSVVGTVGHGIYIANTSGLLIEGNILDHNGWNDNISGATPSVFRHGIYLQQSGFNIDHVVKNNIIARSSSHGVQMRNGGTMYNNLFLSNSIGFLLGGGDDGIDGGVEVDAYGNVILRGKNLDGSNLRGWGMTLENISFGRVSGNIITNRVSGDFPLSFESSTNTYLVNELEFDNNIVYNWGQGFEFDGPTADYGSIKFRNNQISTSGNYLLSMQNLSLTGKFTSSNNRFNSLTIPTGQWFYLAGNYTIDQYKSFVNDTTSYSGADPWTDPNRDITGYDTLINGPGTFEHFLGVLRTQSKRNFNPGLTAAAVNNYIRRGFDLEDPAFEVSLEGNEVNSAFTTSNTTLNKSVFLPGVSNSIFNTIGNSQVSKYLNSNISGQFSFSNNLNITKYLNGSCNSIFTSGPLNISNIVSIVIEGQSDSYFSILNDLSLEKSLIGSSNSLLSQNSDLLINKYLGGNTNNIFSSNASFAEEVVSDYIIYLRDPSNFDIYLDEVTSGGTFVYLTGYTNSNFTLSNDLYISKYLDGNSISSFESNIDLRKSVYASGSSSGSYFANNSILLNKYLNGSINSSFNETNNISLSKIIFGISQSLFTTNSNTLISKNFSGSSNSIFNISNRISIGKLLSSNIENSFISSSNILLSKYLNGISNSIFGASLEFSGNVYLSGFSSSIFNTNNEILKSIILNGQSQNNSLSNSNLFLGKTFVGNSNSVFNNSLDLSNQVFVYLFGNLNSNFSSNLNLNLNKYLGLITNSSFNSNNNIIIGKTLLLNSNSEFSNTSNIINNINLNLISNSSFITSNNIIVSKILNFESNPTFNTYLDLIKQINLSLNCNSNFNTIGLLNTDFNLRGDISSSFTANSNVLLQKLLGGNSNSIFNTDLVLYEYFSYAGSIDEWLTRNDLYFRTVSSIINRMLTNNLVNELDNLVLINKDPDLYNLANLYSMLSKQYSLRMYNLDNKLNNSLNSIGSINTTVQDHENRINEIN